MIIDYNILMTFPFDKKPFIIPLHKALTALGVVTAVLFAISVIMFLALLIGLIIYLL